MLFRSRKVAPARAKARKPSKAAKTTKRTVAKAKAKRAPVKKVARKVKQPVAPVVETVTAEVIELPVAVTNETSTGPKARVGTTTKAAR